MGKGSLLKTALRMALKSMTDAHIAGAYARAECQQYLQDLVGEGVLEPEPDGAGALARFRYKKEDESAKPRPGIYPRARSARWELGVRHFCTW